MIDLAALQGLTLDLHTHTSFSDGANTPEEMVAGLFCVLGGLLPFNLAMLISSKNQDQFLVSIWSSLSQMRFLCPFGRR